MTPSIYELQRSLEHHAKSCIQAEQREQQLSEGRGRRSDLAALEEATEEMSYHSKEAKRLVKQLRAINGGQAAILAAEHEVARWREERGFPPGPMPGTYANW